MLLLEKGILCGSSNYTPKLEVVGNTYRLTFYMLFTRGGNTKKNYDIFSVKAFGELAKKYYESMQNDKMRGQTVSCQLSLENNSTNDRYELICSFIRFDIGETINLNELPDCAKKETTKETIVTSNVSCATNIVTSEQQKKDISKNISEKVPEKVQEETKKEIVHETIAKCEDLLEPIGLIQFANSILTISNNVVKGKLAQDAAYLDFRELMG